jgi:hypothetical protein
VEDVLFVDAKNEQEFMRCTELYSKQVPMFKNDVPNEVLRNEHYVWGSLDIPTWAKALSSIAS